MFSIANQILNVAFCDTSNEKIAITSVPQDYSVEFFDKFDSAFNDKFKKFTHIIIDEKLKKLYPHIIEGAQHLFEITAKEDNKTVLKTIEVCEFLQEANADKSSLVGVIGGGIVQDIGAYACRTFKRGLPWCYVPTTMLSMTDSCIGGKTGLNHKKYKNMMALFSAPTEVLVCTAFLETLEDGDLRSGLGETLKLCVTGGREPFSAYEKLVDSALARNKDALKKLIYISLLVKKAVVENDEFEKDIRKGLNYGHSIGHALEAVCDFRIPHGIAVAMGIIIENLMFSDISKNYVAADISRINRMAKNLYGSSYDNIIRSLNFDGLKTALFNDKKTQAGSLTLAPAAEVGRLEFTQVNLNSENLDNIIHLIKGHL